MNSVRGKKKLNVAQKRKINNVRKLQNVQDWKQNRELG